METSTESSNLDFEKRLLSSFDLFFSVDNSLHTSKYFNNIYWSKIAKIVKRPIMECKNKWYFLIQQFFCFSRMEKENGYDWLCSQWSHYEMLKKMQPKMIQSYTQLFYMKDMPKQKQESSVQQQELIAQIELKKYELMKCTTSCTRRQELWTDISNHLNEKFHTEKKAIIEWQSVWWELKEELRQLLSKEDIDMDGLLPKHHRVLKICGINAISDIDAKIKLDKNYEFDENVNDLVCKNCSSAFSGWWLEDGWCKKCLQSYSTLCDICAKADSTSSLFTKDWNSRARHLLPKICREKRKLSLCSYCHSRLKEKASLLWKVCRVCAKDNQQLENLMSSSYADVRQIFHTAIGCTIRLSDGLPCFVCIKCRDDLLDFVRFYLTFSSTQDKLLKIHQTSLIGKEEISCTEGTRLTTKRPISLPQRSSKRLRLHAEKKNSFVALNVSDEYCEIVAKKKKHILKEESESQLEVDMKAKEAYISSEDEALSEHSERSIISMEESEVSDQDTGTLLKSSALESTDRTERGGRERKYETRNNSASNRLERDAKKEKNTNCASIEAKVRISPRRKTQTKSSNSGCILKDVENQDCSTSDDTPATSTSKQCNSNDTKNEMSDSKRLEGNSRTMLNSEESSKSGSPIVPKDNSARFTKTYGKAYKDRPHTALENNENTRFESVIENNLNRIVDDVEIFDSLIHEDDPSTSSLATAKHCLSNETNNEMSQPSRLEGISNTISIPQERRDSENTTVGVLVSSMPYSNDTVTVSTAKNSLSTSKTELVQQTSKLKIRKIPPPTENNTSSTVRLTARPNQEVPESSSTASTSQEKPACDMELREKNSSKLQVKKQPENILIEYPPKPQPNKQLIVDFKVSNSLMNKDKQQLSETTNKLLKDLLKRPALRVTPCSVALPLSVRTATTTLPDRTDIMSVTVSSNQRVLPSLKPSTSKSEINTREALKHKKLLGEMLKRCVLESPRKPAYPLSTDSPRNSIEIIELDDDTQNIISENRNKSEKSSQEIDIILIGDDSPSSQLNAAHVRGVLDINVNPLMNDLVSNTATRLRTDIALHKTLLPDDDDDNIIEMELARGQITNMGQLHQSSLIDRVVERSFRTKPTFLQIKDVSSINAYVNPINPRKDV